jgi:CelD/BcsL family acetyltransferase involved in cellulose biosynthesis
MEYRFKPFATLNKDEISLWRRLQAAHEHLDSPFYRPEFTEAMHHIHGNVETCVLLEKGLPVGFFPFQRTNATSGKPVGQSLNECQGVIAPLHARPNPADLMQACGINAWDFERVAKNQVWCQAYAKAEHKHFSADLKEGFERYANVLRNRGTLEMREADRLKQKIDREVGEVRIEVNTHIDEMWHQMLNWKGQQAKITGAKNALAVEANATFFRETLKSPDLGYQGIIAGLYAGRQLLAVDAGLRSNHVVHHLWWSCDPGFARFAPAQVLRYCFYQWAASNKIRRIDLGRTPEDYKAALATSETTFQEGSVTTTIFANITRQISFGFSKILSKKNAS